MLTASLEVVIVECFAALHADQRLDFACLAGLSAELENVRCGLTGDPGARPSGLSDSTELLSVEDKTWAKCL